MEKEKPIDEWKLTWVEKFHEILESAFDEGCGYDFCEAVHKFTEYADEENKKWVERVKRSLEK